MFSRFSPTAASVRISFLCRAEYNSTERTHTVYPSALVTTGGFGALAPAHHVAMNVGVTDTLRMSAKEGMITWLFLQNTAIKRQQKSGWALWPSSETSREAMTHSMFTLPRGSPQEEGGAECWF